MSKFIILDRDSIYNLRPLYEAKNDNAYIVLEEYNGYSTIAQYSYKYDNIKIVTVLTDNLDKNKALYEA